MYDNNSANLVVDLAIVNPHDASDHFRQHYHVAKMSLDQLRLLQLPTVQFGLLQTLEERLVLALESTIETTTGTAMQQLGKLSAKQKRHKTVPIHAGENSLLIHIQQLVELHTTVDELAECALLLDLSHGFSHDCSCLCFAKSILKEWHT
jgi:hypothetical protein